MVAPSKIFHPPMNCYHCSQSLVHPGIGCLRHFFNNLILHGLGGLKYFSPLLISPLVLKFKIMNRELLFNTIKYYLTTVCWTTLATSSIFYMICCLRNYLGRFRMYTALFVPTVLGLQFCWFFPSRVMTLFTTTTSQATLEAMLRYYSNPFTHLILHSNIVQTLLFMINSAIILHFKRKNIYKDYWFISPYENDKATIGTTEETANGGIYHENSTKKCVHSDKMSCQNYLLDGIKSYLKFSIPLDLFTMIMAIKLPQTTQGLIPKTLAILKTFRPNMTRFFVSYIGIYRLSSCLLRKYYSNLSLDVQHMLSAFLGGSSYLFVNKVNFMTLSLVISVQIFWQQFCKSIQSRESEKTQNLVLMLLKHTPFSQIIFTLNGGFLLHSYIFNYQILNSLARGFLEALTYNQIKTFRDTLINSDLKTLMELAESRSIKTLL